MTTGSNLYSQGFGTTSSASFPGNAIVQTRDPAASDIKGPQGNYSVGQLWVNTIDQESWQLLGFSSVGGNVLASWVLLGGGDSSLNTLSGNTGTATPSGANIAIVGTGNVSVAASGSTLTISDTGSGGISTLSGNSGSATGSTVTISGTGALAFSGSGATLSGQITPGSSLVSSVTSDSGSATPSSGVITIHGGSGITTSATGSTVTIASSGGSGIATLTGDSGSATGSSVAITGGTTGLTTTGTSATVSLGGTLALANGGTGVASFTDSNAIVLTGTSLHSLSPGTAGYLLSSTGSGTPPQWTVGGVVSTGTWSPALSFGGASVGITYALNSGTYIQIGGSSPGNSMIMASVNITLTSKGSSTGNAQISLPTSLNSPIPIVCSPMQISSGITIDSGYSMGVPVISSGTLANLIELATGSTAGSANLTDANFSDTASFILTLIYRT